MLQVLTEVPRALMSVVPAGIGPALGSLAPARVPQSSQKWLSAAESVSQGWADGGNATASASLMAAAKNAAHLEGRAGSLDSAVVQGASAIASAVVDLARIAMEFVATAAQSFAGSVAGGPAGLAAGMAGVAAAGQQAMTRALARLSVLEQELAGPISTLSQLISEAEGTPAAPTTRPVSALSSAGTGGELQTDDAAGSEDSSFVNSSSDAPTPQAQAAVDNALSAVGTPYQWGGNTPGQGLDCSGLTHWAYGQAGVDIPRTAAEQAVGRPVNQNELLPGDLVVWDGHVAMVVGDGQMVEAGDPVQVNPIRTSNMGMGFKGFYRPTG